MQIIAASPSLAIYRSSSLLLKDGYVNIHKMKTIFLKNLLYHWEPLVGPGLRLISAESNSSNGK